MSPADLDSHVYDELRKLAAAKLAAEKPGQTLDATALVHEAWLKLSGTFENRGHYFPRRPRPCGASSSTTQGRKPL